MNDKHKKMRNAVRLFKNNRSREITSAGKESIKGGLLTTS